MMARMGSGLAIVLQLLLLFAASEQLLGVVSSVEEASTQSTTTTMNPRGGFTGSLIRRDHYFAQKRDVSLTREEQVKRDAAKSRLRVQSLMKRQLAGKAATPSSSPNPSPGTSDWETTLSDAAAAEYVMEISLGTPPQSFVAIADTGSDLTWLQCGSCSSCSEGICTPCSSGNGTFEPTKSSSYGPLSCSSSTCAFLNESGSICPISSANSSTGCPYAYGYGDGSTTQGTLAQETITLQDVAGGSQTVSDYWFGCSIKADSNSSLLDHTDGLVGLGRGNISFPTQLGKYFGRTFGYCLVNRSVSDGLESSPLYFGSDAVPAAKLQYTPLVNNPFVSTFYYVNCNGISLAGENIGTIPASAFAIDDQGNGGIFFDSGTTYTSLADSVLDSLSEALQNQISGYVVLPDFDGFPLCYFARWKTWIADYGKGVPVISFQFQNTTGYTLVVDNAWIQVNDATVCLAMQKSGSKGSIFGNYQQVSFHVLYDLEKERIGFVPADCKPTITGEPNSSHRRVARWGSSLVSTLLSLVLLLVFTQ